MKLNTLIMSLALFGFVASTIPMSHNEQTAELTANQELGIVDSQLRNSNDTSTWKDTVTGFAVVAFVVTGIGIYMYAKLQQGLEDIDMYKAANPLTRYLKGWDQKICPQYLFDTITSLQNSNIELQKTVAEISKKLAELAVQK